MRFMVRVKVRAFAFIREKVGWKEKEFEVDGRTVEDLLKMVETIDGGSLHELVVEEGKVKSSFLILLNGREISYLNGLKTRIKGGDTVFVFPPAGGG